MAADAFAAEVTAALQADPPGSPRRAAFAAFVGARFAHQLGDEEVGAIAVAPLWAAARGAPGDDAARERAIAAVARERAMADPDRLTFLDVVRSLDVIDLALGGSLPDLVVAALSMRASVSFRDPMRTALLAERWTWESVQGELRWIAALSRALTDLAPGAPVDTEAVREILAPLAASPRPDPAPGPRATPRVVGPVLPAAAVEEHAVAMGPIELGSRPDHAAPLPRRDRTGPPANPRVVTTRVGDSTLRLIQTEASYPALYRAEVDGAPRRLVVRRDGGSWVEADEGELEILASLIDEGATRAESPGRLVLSRYTPDAILRSWDMTEVAIHVDASGKVVIDIDWWWEPGSFY